MRLYSRFRLFVVILCACYIKGCKGERKTKREKIKDVKHLERAFKRLLSRNCVAAGFASVDQFFILFRVDFFNVLFSQYPTILHQSHKLRRPSGVFLELARVSNEEDTMNSKRREKLLNRF